jgi:hypothetical protein
MFSAEWVLMDFCMQPLCWTDPMLVLEFSMLVLESCPTQTIELLLSGNIPADLVNSYLKQHAPSMQGRYLELMLVMNENGISGNLQNEMVRTLAFIFFLIHSNSHGKTDGAASLTVFHWVLAVLLVILL